MNASIAKLAALTASMAMLGACGAGGTFDVDEPPATAAEPQTDKERLERRYVVSVDTTRIAARLEPGALDAIADWNDGTVPVPYAGEATYDTKTSWTWQLTGEPIETGYDANVYVLDLFAQTDGRVQAELEALGRDAFCYFSVGTYEPWRPDRGFFDDDMLGDAHVAYADERWLDITDPRTVRIMLNRMDMAKAIGCDGVELDNVDGYENVTGQPNFTQANATAYAKVLANAAHERGLAVALKNGPALLPDVIDWFDLSINESCHHFDECAPYRAMTDAGKPVFNAEYAMWADEDTPIPEGTPRHEAALDAVCRESRELDLRTLLLPKSLDGSSRYSCDDRPF